MLKIGLFSYVFPHVKSGYNPGIETVVYNLAMHLSRKAEVTVYTSLINGGQKEDRLGPIRILRCGGIRSPLFSLNMHTQVINILKEYKTEIFKEDILHDVGSYITLWIGRLQKPCLATFHHYESPHNLSGYLTTPTFPILRKKYSKADKVVTPSEFSKQQLLKKFRIEEQKICVIPWGIDPGIYNSSTMAPYHAKNTVLFVGTLTGRKGIIYLVRATPLVKKQIDDIKIFIIGEGPQRALLFKEAEKLGVKDNIEFLNYVPKEELSRHYRAATISVVPSLLEGFGQTALESMASATPVIASNIEPLTSLIGDAGLYFTRGDHMGLAQQIIRLLKDEPLRASLAEKARNRAKQYSWENTAEHHLDLYRQLLKRGV